MPGPRYLMNNLLFLLLSLAITCGLSAEIRAVIPANGPKPVGPYTPGVMAGDYLYVSGQGARRPDGEMSAEFDEQVRQTLENVKMIVEAAHTSHSIRRKPRGRALRQDMSTCVGRRPFLVAVRSGWTAGERSGL